MSNSREKAIEPLCMLPRFHSQAILNETHLEHVPQSNSICTYNSLSLEDFFRHETTNQTVSNSLVTHLLLPKFHSHHQLISYDENQSADVTKLSVDESQNKFHIEVPEQTYDRSGRNWRLTIYTSTEKSAYTIMGDTLESYSHFRKLPSCKALSNFLEYRNKIYKREKLAQYAPLKTKALTERKDSQHTKHIPTRTIHASESQTTPSLISEAVSLNITPSVAFKITPNQSPAIKNEEYIQIPSVDLLKRSPSESPQHHIKPKRINGSAKRTPSPSIKG
ncbi:unnamed protein product [Rotaria magnacalcarata]|uniref:Uncharacterized protein n=1 Tax=Rotaria magnacalcarata TaxID=392030 RepID=A0A815QJH9_9BILA|nr:unnamed protein product [Rotaria magnacalcarata]CAF1940764.1 unnamed protein product [Rotaria magnacalcarata]